MDFSDIVISWYRENKRDLPWRKTTDPYIIWLSEVILQQTRVEQGLPYFHNFSEKYPTVAHLASAGEEDVLKMWQGLGYYSRGRNMHHTANVVMEEHGGYFPKTYKELIGLKGIGDYTASAISSFASNEVKAVVDGNVFRLLSRFFGIDEPIDAPAGRQKFTLLANELIDRAHPALFNQAIMEFGSLQCKPRNPYCPACPLRPECAAYALNRVNELPVKSKKQNTRKRFFNYIIASKHGELLINKRGPGDIWQHLYEFPLFETEDATEPHQLIATSTFREKFGENAVIEFLSGPVTHVLSHQKLITMFIGISGYEEKFPIGSDWFYASPEELLKLPQPKLIFAFLRNYPDFHSDQL